MEAKDRELLKTHRKSNYELDKLAKEHDELEAKISEMEHAKGLSPDDEIRLHKLKKRKLEGRERLEEIFQTLR
ncbi:MAG: hypothetical protein A2600_10175 [Candidatus Lambdaproteobacteria bacterium RIFOXYD1_FULL_56_27]|uniref:DUF465 domain-containing protein n=1 Tax=Candidatus Lambdaproteobacteria bacterium RIFOXYD2_FULL_56_26 TaxID=1817773 RepID=A0A1F6H1U8_9PROT|nr:MAG: hypothetical protein A2426_12285 [Candidatus Lambdaproteobacteria bacterium RIFOXYC1_FULL_56_13]OGH04341.1 MAG: hypothetical protein A2557_10865 [Candidatus Lambdaproteobacteria bacterium RIFOXYD2_FULL_56_26]OGH08684.1 MAG: hypothetical protein A2600_10175 [Candidatus Lambdaproteobacteria bacterium RIFOXYD1_FULL_56_27]